MLPVSGPPRSPRPLSKPCHPCLPRRARCGSAGPPSSPAASGWAWSWMSRKARTTVALGACATSSARPSKVRRCLGPGQWDAAVWGWGRGHSKGQGCPRLCLFLLRSLRICVQGLQGSGRSPLLCHLHAPDAPDGLLPRYRQGPKGTQRSEAWGQMGGEGQPWGHRGGGLVSVVLFLLNSSRREQATPPHTHPLH